MMNKLNVGDVVYKYCHGSISERLIIDRVTKTMAFSGNYKFRIDYASSIYEINQNRYSLTSFLSKLKK